MIRFSFYWFIIIIQTVQHRFVCSWIWIFSLWWGKGGALYSYSHCLRRIRIWDFWLRPLLAGSWNQKNIHQWEYNSSNTQIFSNFIPVKFADDKIKYKCKVSRDFVSILFQLKRQCHEIFGIFFISWIKSSLAPQKQAKMVMQIISLPQNKNSAVCTV